MVPEEMSEVDLRLPYIREHAHTHAIALSKVGLEYSLT